MNSTALPRRLILAFCCLGMIVMSFSVNAPALCLTAIAGEFHLDAAAQGLLLSGPFWGLFTAILISGVVADRWGPRIMLVTSGVFQVGGFLMLGLAPAKAVVFAGAVIVGMGTGMSDALLSPLVCVVYPEQRARVSNVLHTFYPAGTLILVLIVLILFHLHWPWRWIFRLLAVVSLPYAAGFAVLPMPRRLHIGEDRLPVRTLLASGAFLLLLGAIFLAGVAELGPSQWLPAYVEKAAAGSRTAGTLGLLVFAATMAAGRFLNSCLIQRLNLRWFFLGGGLLCAVGLLLAALPAPVIVTIVCLSAVGLGIAGFWPTILAVAGNRFPEGGALMFSLLAAIGNFGGVAGPLLVGLVAERSSLSAGMAVLAAAPLLVIVLLLALLRRSH